MNIPSIESLLAELDKVKAERDELEVTANAAVNEQITLRLDISRLKSALKEAKEALVMNIVGTGGRTPATHNAIATINKVLGDE